MTSFFAYLTEKDVEHRRDFPLSEYSTMRVGATADAIVYPQSVDKFVSVIRYLEEKRIKYRVLGRMSNVLPLDTPYSGVILSTLRLDHYRIDGDVIDVECGALISRLILRLARDSLGGIESLFGIPGTVGGAVYSNAGAFGLEISDVIHSAVVYDVDSDEIRELFYDDLALSYRKSVLSEKRYILISARLALQRGSYDCIVEKIRCIRKERNLRQPTEYPSLGSIFKRCGDVSAAYYIDRSDLRAFSIGGAQISEKHAGFIINTGGATSCDVSELIKHIKRVVYEKYSIELEEEIEYL